MDTNEPASSGLEMSFESIRAFVCLWPRLGVTRWACGDKRRQQTQLEDSITCVTHKEIASVCAPVVSSLARTDKQTQLVIVSWQRYHSPRDQHPRDTLPSLGKSQGGKGCCRATSDTSKPCAMAVQHFPLL